MSKTKFGIVTGCRTLSIRKDPDPDTEAEDLLGEIVKTPEDIVAEVHRGDTLEYDPEQVCWDCWGREYMKVWTEAGIEGWVPVGALKPIRKKGGANGLNS